MEQIRAKLAEWRKMGALNDDRARLSFDEVDALLSRLDAAELVVEVARYVQNGKYGPGSVRKLRDALAAYDQSKGASDG